MSFAISGVTISGGVTLVNKTTKAYLSIGSSQQYPIDPVEIGQSSPNGYFSYNSIGASSDTSGFGPYFSDVKPGWLVNGGGLVNVPLVYGPDIMGPNIASFQFTGYSFVVGESYTFTDPN